MGKQSNGNKGSVPGIASIKASDEACTAGRAAQFLCVT